MREEIDERMHKFSLMRPYPAPLGPCESWIELAEVGKCNKIPAIVAHDKGSMQTYQEFQSLNLNRHQS